MREYLLLIMRRPPVFNEYSARGLLDTSNEVAGPLLRSGMYAIDVPTNGLIYMLYWPEETTWDDSAPPSVVRNRVTFMRRVSSTLLIHILETHFVTDI